MPKPPIRASCAWIAARFHPCDSGPDRHGPALPMPDRLRLFRPLEPPFPVPAGI
jgi:hypothetical protein